MQASSGNVSEMTSRPYAWNRIAALSGTDDTPEREERPNGGWMTCERHQWGKRMKALAPKMLRRDSITRPYWIICGIITDGALKLYYRGHRSQIRRKARRFVIKSSTRSGQTEATIV